MSPGSPRGGIRMQGDLVGAIVAGWRRRSGPRQRRGRHGEREREHSRMPRLAPSGRSIAVSAVGHAPSGFLFAAAV
jgi:hypothetical protein